jgi:hypothetical protein
MNANPMFQSIIKGNHIQNMPNGFQSVLLPQNIHNQTMNSMILTQKMAEGNNA